MPKVLIAEDEETLAHGLEVNLRREGFDVVRARRGDTVVELVARTAPDLITLDVMLPGMSGLDVCRELRRQGVGVPIIMVTARAEEVDRVLGLEIGADDYLVKPFSVRELIARIRAHLRRESRHGESALNRHEFGRCTVDFEHFTATRDGKPLDLTTREFGILQLLVRAQGEVVTRDRMLDEVWGSDTAVNARTVDMHLLNLRRKLEDDPTRPRFITSVYGEGYRFTR